MSGSLGSEFTKVKGYEQRSNANLVLQSADKPKSKISNEPTGEPETLKGRVSIEKFGDRASVSKPQSQKKRAAPPPTSGRPEKRAKRNVSVLENNEMDGIKYQPQTNETRRAYESLLNFVRSRLGDQQQTVIMSAADEVLAVLKDEEIKPTDKQELLEELLNKLSPDEFHGLHKMVTAINDYEDDADTEAAPNDEDAIAVVFGEEEPADDEDEGVYELDEESEDELMGDETEQDTQLKMEEDDEADEDASLDIDPHKIDAYWLQRELGKFYDDAVEAQTVANQVFAILASDSRLGELENELAELLGFSRFDFIKLLLHNRYKILYCTRLNKAQNPEERAAIEAQMEKIPELKQLLLVLQGKADVKKDSRQKREAALKREAMDIVEQASVPVSQFLDLDELAFQQGSHLMSNKKPSLPEGSYHKQKKGYEEVVIPSPSAPAYKDTEQLINISSLPKWVQPAFKGIRQLNRVQSHVYNATFEGADNILLCAPTGGGKTNCAMLTMLHEIGQHINKDTLKVDPTSFKIVYIAPMKSLVQEMVHTFGKRLKPFGITVGELTGDSSLTKAQIDETQLIFTTPEKWDIITRKSGEKTYTELVRLVIIDEIHLLHDTRGAVLESIISRTLRQVESSQEMVRLMGLSATLPNYKDVANFLRVKPENLFAFPNSYRPVPLGLNFVGISVKAPFKRFQLMNKLCYEKVSEHAGSNQCLVFVHSRKETAKTAKLMRDTAVEDNTIGRYLEDTASRTILTAEAENCDSADLKELLPYGFAIHHAGLSSEDRTLVEDLFADKHIQVLCSTATLAWGVNLPAHAVVIKGTKVYSPEKSEWIELSALDVMQMLGRAGRPGLDIKGEGVLITGRDQLEYYLSLMNEQLPIESQFIKSLAHNLNAEIVLGTIQNAQDAINWLTYTYLYVCMLRSPELYGVSIAERNQDRTLKQRRYDLIHSAATTLAKNNLIKYDRKSGTFDVTDLGKIASHYYLTPFSMSQYNEHMKISTGDIELLRVFSLSEEFKNCNVRPDERMELQKLMERVPFPVKESIDDSSAKINVLLQAYVSRLNLDGFSLASDMVYVKQSAGRVMRALFEIALKRGWALLAEKALKWCQMIDRKMWSTQSPLRQFGKLPADILKKLEKKQMTVDRMFDLDSHEIGQGIEYPSLGSKVYKLVHRFPRVDVAATVQPITRSLLRVDLNISPDFTFVEEYHGHSVSFWIIVENVDGDRILHHERFVLKEKYADDAAFVSFTVPLYEPMPPQYFIKIIADRWLGAVTTIPISFRNLVLPEKYPPPTKLLDLQPLPVAAFKIPEFEQIYRDIRVFNPIQTQTFNTLFSTDHNALICAPSGSGKILCAEFALLREFARETPRRAVAIEPTLSLAKERLREWSEKFGESLGKRITLLTGDWSVDQKLLRADVVLATPQIWDMTSRRWKQRKSVQNVGLYIIDELHTVGGEDGPELEIIISRIRDIAHLLKVSKDENDTSPGTRIVGLSTSLANAKDVGEWIGATPSTLFNFHPNIRPVPLEIVMQGFDHGHFKERMLSMSKTLLYSVNTHAKDKPVLIWVPSRSVARNVASDLVKHALSADPPLNYLHCKKSDLEPLLVHIKSKALRACLESGVGFFHEALSNNEREVVLQLYKSGAIQVIVVAQAMCWEFHQPAHLVVIMGTEYYDGKQHSYVDYTITNLLNMVGKAGRPNIDESAKCLIYGHARRKEYYKKFIYEPLPIESHLDQYLNDHLNAEIVNKTIENKQDAVDYLTWTFFYRRLTQNPNYYNLQGISHRQVSDFLSDLVEDTLGELESSRCVAIEEDEVSLSPLNLGIISSYYYIKYTTIELFNDSLTRNTKMLGLIEILSHATEFESLAIRHREPRLLAKLASHLRLKINKPDYSSVATKVNILLQCHFSRRLLPADLVEDQNVVLKAAPRLLQAMVDVISSNGWLNPAIAAMELSQMIIQGMWENDSPLRQLPHLDNETIDHIKKTQPDVESVLDILDLEDKDRNKILSHFTPQQMTAVANAANNFPSIEVQYQFADENSIVAGSSTKLAVQLERDLDEGEKLAPVHAPFYPMSKTEGWWLLLGNVDKNELYAIKKVSIAKSVVTTMLEFEVPSAGSHEVTLSLMSDSYIDADREVEFSFAAKPSGESDPMDTSD